MVTRTDISRFNRRRELFDKIYHKHPHIYDMLNILWSADPKSCKLYLSKLLVQDRQRAGFEPAIFSTIVAIKGLHDEEFED